MTAALSREVGPSVWLGARLDAGRLTHRLDDAAIAEIDAALDHLRGLGELDFPAIGPETFPLPTLGSGLARLAEALRSGRGIVLLRGLPADRLAPDDLARVLYGLGAHIGRALPQSHHGELLGHVMDVSDVEPGARGYHTGRALGFHTDNCDIVALMCLRAAPGGRSRLVSAGAAHNRMLAAHPDMLERLYDGIVHRRQPLDAERGSGIASRKVAIYSRASGELSAYLNFGYVRRALSDDPAALAPAEVAAAETFRRVLRDPRLPLEMDFQPGDIQLLNNRRVLHGRSAYESAAAVGQRRHLLRLWLAVPSWPPLPADQGMHDAADHAGWIRHRVPLMELPSRYLAGIERRRSGSSEPSTA